MQAGLIIHEMIVGSFRAWSVRFPQTSCIGNRMNCLPIRSKLKVTSLTRIRAGVVLVWTGSEAAVLGANVLGFCMSVLNI